MAKKDKSAPREVRRETNTDSGNVEKKWNRWNTFTGETYGVEKHSPTPEQIPDTSVPSASPDLTRFIAVKVARLGREASLAYEQTLGQRPERGENDPDVLLQVARTLHALGMMMIRRDRNALRELASVARNYLERVDVRSLDLDSRGKPVKRRAPTEWRVDREGNRIALPGLPLQVTEFRGGDIRPERADTAIFLREHVATYLELNYPSENIAIYLGHIIAQQTSALREELAQAGVNPIDMRRLALITKAIESARTREVKHDELEDIARRVLVQALTAMGYSKARTLFDYERKKPR